MKKILYILIGLVLVVIIAIGVLVAVINPNDFKPLISDQVEKSTGRDLVINGDINWRFWPSLGLSVEKLEFKNPQGFAEPDLISLNKAEMSVAVMPLLSDTLDIGVVSLYGAHVFIQTLPNGKSNLDGLANGGAENSSASSESTSPSSDSTSTSVTDENTAPSNKKWKIAIGGLELVNSSAIIRDDQTGTVTEISKLNLKVGKLATGLWVPIEFNVGGRQNALAFTVRGTVQAMMAKDAMKSQLRHLSLSSTVKDAKFILESFSLNADQLGLALPATIGFSAKGKADDVSFDASGTTQLLVDEAMTIVSLLNLDLASALSGSALPRPDMNIGVKSDVAFDIKAGKLSLSKLVATVDEVTVEGIASVLLADIPAIRFDLKSKKINVDTFLDSASAKSASSNDAVATSSSTKVGKSAKVAPLSDVEPDLSALRGLDISGKMMIGNLIVSNVKVSEVGLAFAINRGKVDISQFDAKLYGGTVAVKGYLDTTVSPARYHVIKGLKNVSVQPLLMDIAQEDILSGTGNIDVNVNGVGLSEKRLRSGITGTVAINFADGAINGINIPEMIRKARATLKGKGDGYVDEAKKTDFSGLTSTFHLGGGNASTQDFKLEAPAIRVRSEGVTNLLTETLNFKVFASVVGTSKGQGGQGIDELKDITIPVSIGGTWQAPTYELDIKALLSNNKVLGQKVRKEAERGLKKLLGDKIDDDKVKQVTDKLFKGLFN